MLNRNASPKRYSKHVTSSRADPFVAQIKEVTSFSLSSKILSTKTPSVASGELEAGPCVRLLVASVQAAPVGRSEKMKQ